MQSEVKNMKLMIASDIHGSAKYCDLMLQKFHMHEADKLLILGDILYHGPRNPLPEDYAPKQVFEMLNPEKKNIMAVQGNCDAHIDNVVLEFPIVPDYILMEINGLTIYATHGHIFNEKNPLPLHNNEIMLNGHFHTPAFSQYEDWLYMNPGSVSMPKDGTPHSYIIMEGKTFKWYNLLNDEVFGEVTIM